MSKAMLVTMLSFSALFAPKPKSKKAKQTGTGNPSKSPTKFVVPENPVPLPTIPKSLSFLTVYMNRNFMVPIINILFPDYEDINAQLSALLETIIADPAKIQEEQVKQRYTTLSQQQSNIIKTAEFLLNKAVIDVTNILNKNSNVFVKIEFVDDRIEMNISDSQTKDFITALENKIVDMIKRSFNEQFDQAKNRKQPTSEKVNNKSEQGVDSTNNSSKKLKIKEQGSILSSDS